MPAKRKYTQDERKKPKHQRTNPFSITIGSKEFPGVIPQQTSQDKYVTFKIPKLELSGADWPLCISVDNELRQLERTQFHVDQVSKNTAIACFKTTNLIVHIQCKGFGIILGAWYKINPN